MIVLLVVLLEQLEFELEVKMIRTGPWIDNIQ